MCLCGAYCQSGTHAGTCCGSGGALLPSSGAESREKDTGMLRGRAGIRIMNSPRTPGSPAVGPAVFWESEKFPRSKRNSVFWFFWLIYNRSSVSSKKQIVEFPKPKQMAAALKNSERQRLGGWVLGADAGCWMKFYFRSSVFGSSCIVAHGSSGANQNHTGHYSHRPSKLRRHSNNAVMS